MRSGNGFNCWAGGGDGREIVGEAGGEAGGEMDGIFDFGENFFIFDVSFIHGPLISMKL